ncbi:hypothetical protein K525DRAFT_198918, partial [Schizophyllum commune Loenen D]
SVLYERLTTIPPSPELRDRPLPVPPPPVISHEPPVPPPPLPPPSPRTMQAANGEGYRLRPIPPDARRSPGPPKVVPGPGGRPMVVQDPVISPPEMSSSRSMSAGHSARADSYSHIPPPPPPSDARHMARGPPGPPGLPPEVTYDARQTRVAPSASMTYSPRSSHPAAYSHAPPDPHYGHVPPAHPSRTRSHSRSRPVPPTPPHNVSSGYPPHPSHHTDAIPGPSMQSPPHLDRRRMYPYDPHEHPIPHDTHNNHRPRSPRVPMSPVDTHSPYALHDRSRAGPGSYADDTRRDREWDGEWERDRGEYPPRRVRESEASPSYGPPPPPGTRPRQVTANGDYVDHRASSRRDDPYFPPVPAPDYGPSATSPGPVSGSGSVPSDGPHRVAPYPRPREAEQGSYRLRPVAQDAEYDERWSHPSRDRAASSSRSAYPYPEPPRPARGPPPSYPPVHPAPPPPPSQTAPRKRPREDVEMADADDRRPPPPRLSYPGHPHPPHDSSYAYYHESHQSRPPPSSHHYHHRHYRHDEDNRGP